MKLLPIFALIAAALACGGLKDRSDSAKESSPVISQTPSPAEVNVSNHSLPLPRTISGGILNDKATSLPLPEYPPAARAVKAAGTVQVQVLVDEEGRVVSVSAMSGHPLLRLAAERAARKATFVPVESSGRTVKVSGILKYEFNP